MKKRFAIVLGLVVALALGSLGCAGGVAAEGADTSGVILTSEQNTGIWVTGMGRMSVVPDLLQLNLGVQVEKDTVAAAQAEAAQTMEMVIAALHEGGISDEDIQTTQFSIEPVYQWIEDGREWVITGYRVTNMVRADIHELSDAGPIIDSAVAAGGSYIVINGISLTVDEPEAYETQLRELAMAHARAKAEELARLGGVTLGKPTYIGEVGGSGFAPRNLTKDEVATTPILPGEMEISLYLQVVYSIE